MLGYVVHAAAEELSCILLLFREDAVNPANFGKLVRILCDSERNFCSYPLCYKTSHRVIGVLCFPLYL